MGKLIMVYPLLQMVCKKHINAMLEQFDEKNSKIARTGFNTFWSYETRKQGNCFRLAKNFSYANPDQPMINNRFLAVVMPAYNAVRTLRRTWEEVVKLGVVDTIILVDDKSADGTVELARNLDGLIVHVHAENKGYGGNQKTCYRLALEAGAEIVIMVHPDYQYLPQLIPAMGSMIAQDLYDCVLGSRILGGHAMEGGMPMWKYAANRALTGFQNLIMGTKLSEFHTGYRAFSRGLLERLPLHENSDDFVFDNQILAQIFWSGARVGEVSCPTRYFKEASSINFPRSVRYGLGCLATSFEYRIAKGRLTQLARFPGTLKNVFHGRYAASSHLIPQY
jgi:glycosyltransferase involved in cell wall biosynthesis